MLLATARVASHSLYTSQWSLDASEHEHAQGLFPEMFTDSAGCCVALNRARHPHTPPNLHSNTHPLVSTHTHHHLQQQKARQHAPRARWSPAGSSCDPRAKGWNPVWTPAVTRGCPSRTVEHPFPRSRGDVPSIGLDAGALIVHAPGLQSGACSGHLRGGTAKWQWARSAICGSSKLGGPRAAALSGREGGPSRWLDPGGRCQAALTC
jgi:hypothetical protein